MHPYLPLSLPSSFSPSLFLCFSPSPPYLTLSSPVCPFLSPPVSPFPSLSFFICLCLSFRSFFWSHTYGRPDAEPGAEIPLPSPPSTSESLILPLMNNCNQQQLHTKRSESPQIPNPFQIARQTLQRAARELLLYHSVRILIAREVHRCLPAMAATSRNFGRSLWAS